MSEALEHNRDPPETEVFPGVFIQDFREQPRSTWEETGAGADAQMNMIEEGISCMEYLH